jgi:Transmembrane secretion effector
VAKAGKRTAARRSLRVGVFEDLSQEGRFLETFKLDSWLEHLRQHERVTHADREQQELVHRFQLEGKPMVSHLIAASAPIDLWSEFS